MICFLRESRLSMLKALPVAAFVAGVSVMMLAIAPRAQGQYTVIHNFGLPGTAGDRSSPNGDMIQDSDGNLYGTAQRGGDGVAFKLDQNGVLAVLYAFSCDAPPIGCFPDAGLFRDPAGDLYGTTTWGKHSKCLQAGQQPCRDPTARI
jgi:uncharacterized repeat protein (TIGR03803 family)